MPGRWLLGNEPDGARGRAQVELAQLAHQLPRLSGQGRSKSRVGGGRMAGGGAQLTDGTAVTLVPRLREAVAEALHRAGRGGLSAGVSPRALPGSSPRRRPGPPRPGAGPARPAG